MSSSFEVAAITCADLSSEIVQLGIILYPTDVFHEKFLLRMRECGQKLKDDHPIKRYLKWVSTPRLLSERDQKTSIFLSEILNSKFNLITDGRVKNQIIEALTLVPGKTLAEEVLRSYLYLMIGNVTRSDNILRAIVRRPPVECWKGFTSTTSVYHRVVRDNLDQVFSKLSKHPSDRKTYELFGRYMSEFFNDNILLERLAAHDRDELEGKWAYRAVTRLAPDLSRYVRIGRLEDQKRLARLRKGGLSEDFLVYWVWYFFELDLLHSEASLGPLTTLEGKDPLWLIYLLESERLSDLYISRKGKSFVSTTRSQLRDLMSDKEVFMLALFKLIELGDIDEKLVSETLKFMIHE